LVPGRLEDLISSEKMSLKQCRFFILDEADGLLKGGYENLINRMHEQIPKMTSGANVIIKLFTAVSYDFS
jgi:ATP-dependent RNA helicase DDX1